MPVQVQTKQEFVIHPAAALGYVHLTTADLDRQITFYQSVLGFKLHWKKDATAGLGAGRDDLLRLTELRCAGRVHLHVADLDAAGRFYQDVLGFQATFLYSMAKDFGALFVSAGGYHHHIGLNVWRGVGAPPPPRDAVGLRYFTVVLPDRTELDRVTGRVQAAGIVGEEHSEGILVRDPSQNGVLLTAAPEFGRAVSNSE